MKQMIAALMIALLAVPAAFAQVDNHAKTKKGAVIGGAIGGVLGAVLGNNGRNHSAKQGAVIGVATGGVAGAIIGAMMDKQERDLRQIQGVNVQRVGDNELKVTVKNDVLFDYNSAGLRSASKTSLREMADVFERYPDTTINVQGYTDSTGSASYNQRLSDRRAESVAGYIENLGVRSSRVNAVGYGESNPRASNGSASGRQQNRRVEIHILANAA
jgi:outer membrane protein OmpA-like peptidoglycan-associated protein